MCKLWVGNLVIEVMKPKKIWLKESVYMIEFVTSHKAAYPVGKFCEVVAV